MADRKVVQGTLELLILRTLVSGPLLYRLTARGRKQLAIEQSRWDAVVRAMAKVLKPV